MTTPLFQPICACFLKVVEISLHASLIIGVLLVIRPLIKRALPPRWVYALWFIVIVRLLLIDLPRFPVTGIPSLPSALAATQAVQDATARLPQAILPPSSASTPTNLLPPLTIVWLFGLTTILVHLGASHFRRMRRMAAAPDISSPEIQVLLEECRSEMQIRSVRLVQFPGFASPSMTGLFLPTIVLPEDFLERFKLDEIRWIFRHEMTHLKRWDLPVQFLCHVLQAIHWFNPLVWIAFACFRRDRELACDASVLNRSASTGSLDYGHTLIKVAESYPRSVFMPGFLGVTETRSDLHERVEKISRHRRPALAWIISGIALCGLLAFVFLTRHAIPPHEATAKLQVYKDNAYVPAEIEVIQSSDVVVPAIVGLGLDKIWARRAGSSEAEWSPSEIMDYVSQILSVKMKEGSPDVVYVTVQADDRKEAADIANAIAEQYKKKRHDESAQSASESAHKNYDQKIAEEEQELTDENTKLQKWQHMPTSSLAPNIIENANGQIVSLQRNIDQDKADLAQQIIDGTAQNEGVRILAPAY